VNIARSLFLAATAAFATFGGAVRAEPIHVAVAALPLDHLKTAYLGCDRAANEGAWTSPRSSAASSSATSCSSAASTATSTACSRGGGPRSCASRAPRRPPRRAASEEPGRCRRPGTGGRRSPPPRARTCEDRASMISGKTLLIAHLGYPTEAFKAPLIYNPWFAQRGIDAVVVPIGVKAKDYPRCSPRSPA
jgi:hypothetical protein